MDTVTINKHVFKGSKEYIAGVISAISFTDPDVLFDNEDKIDDQCVGGCELDVMPTIKFGDITSSRKLRTYVMELTELDLQENAKKITLKSLITKRYVHVIYRTTQESDGFETLTKGESSESLPWQRFDKCESVCELYQFDSLDFVYGIKEADKYFDLNITYDVVLDTLNYTQIDV